MGEHVRSDAVYYGRNYELELDDYKRCDRCGFICKLSRDMSSKDGSRLGWGISSTEIGITEYDDESIEYTSPLVLYESTLYDPIVTSGCPQCGCLLY